YDIYMSGVITATAPDGTSYVVNVHDSGPNTDVNTLNVQLPLAQANDLIVRAGFVALVHPASGATPAGPYTADYERVNYDSSASLDLLGGDQGDHFFFIDDGAATTVDAGNGANTFVFGGLFGERQTAAAGTVAAGDDVLTVSTSAGELSPGVSHPTTVYGGTGDNTWVIYSYSALLTLVSQGGDDSYQVRAFDLVGAGGMLSDRIDSALRIDGGTGHSGLLAVGTVLGEQFAVTATQVLGAGLNIQYTRLVRVEVNGDGGSDTYTVLGTAAGAVTQLDGGISGSDTFQVADDIVAAVIADDMAGVPVLSDPFSGSHDAGVLAGALVIDGGAVTPPALVSGVRLATELDVALAVLAAQTPDPDRVATLDVFDDLAAVGQTGSLGQISSGQLGALGVLYAGQALAGLALADFGVIGGLGMSGAQSLVLGRSLSPSALAFDGGIVYGSVDIVDVLLGAGDDTFTVSATPPGSITVVQGGGGSNHLNATGGGGPNSPLALFASTSQDGSYYSSTPSDLNGWARRFTYPPVSAGVLDASRDGNSVILYGGRGNATIIGGAGGDQVAGGSGNDVIYAGQGNDIIHANDGFNIDLTHTLAYDLAHGLGLSVADQPSLSDLPDGDPLASGSDLIYGGSGNDIVIMGHGVVDQDANPLTGTSYVHDAYTTHPEDYGSSSFYGQPGGSAVVLAGSGDQTIDAGHTSHANVIVKNGYVDFTVDDGWIGHLKAVGSTDPGSHGRDKITVGDGNDVIVAGPGNDQITGGNGDKIVLGDDGEVKWAAGVLSEVVSMDPAVSSLSTAAGNLITLGNGNDIVFGGSGYNTIALGAGADIVAGADADLLFDSLGQPASLTSVFSSYGGDDVISATGTGGVIIAGPGHGTLSAPAGYALLDGAGGAAYA
ncbi:MAG: hypothetical protein ACRDNS_01055, partial [Trebonia sp.]